MAANARNVNVPGVPPPSPARRNQNLDRHQMDFINRLTVPTWLLEACTKLRENDPDVTTFNLKGKAIENEYQMDLLCSSLNQNDTVVDFDLSFCCRDNPSLLKIFFRKVLRRSKFQRLWLLNSRMTDDVMIELAESIESNPAMVYLHLDGNDVGDAGGEALAKLLRRPDVKLEWISLSCNCLTDRSCSALAGALRVNTGLEILRLGCNGISVVGANLFRDVLYTSKCGIRSLRIAGNAGIDNKLAEAYQTEYDAVCHRNSKLRYWYDEHLNVNERTRTTSNSSRLEGKNLWPHALGLISTKPDYLYSVIRHQPTIFYDNNCRGGDGDKMEV